MSAPGADAHGATTAAPEAAVSRSPALPRVRVTDAREAGVLDAAAIAAGVPARALMQRAGAAAAGEIAHRFGDRLGGGVLLLAGAGNNGGDAWVVARALAAAGVRCHVEETAAPRTDDARAERALALPVVALGAPPEAPGLVVDGLLGTGARGVPTGATADAIARVAALRATGVPVVALDVPSGLDAGTGASAGAVAADLTICFGTLKRGLLVARERCGAVSLVDIGLAPLADGAPGDGRPDGPDDGRRDEGALPRLVDGAWVQAQLPRIAGDAHKGTRRKLAIVGGAVGMAGAAMLAARAAQLAGIGMTHLCVAPESLASVQAGAPTSLASAWPVDDADADATLCRWADILLVGPGLGQDRRAATLLERLLRRWTGPVVLDADALNLFAGRAGQLGELLAGRDAVLTPHPAEFARLAGVPLAAVLERRFEVGAELAARLGATVLLKGVPTVVAAPDGTRLVSAAGTAALAAAGSGDLLGGVVATLLAQLDAAAGWGPRRALVAAACAAWAHGRAAELATVGTVRGVTLDDVAAALPAVWRESPRAPAYPVLAELPVMP